MCPDRSYKAEMKDYEGQRPQLLGHLTYSHNYKTNNSKQNKMLDHHVTICRKFGLASSNPPVTPSHSYMSSESFNYLNSAYQLQVYTVEFSDRQDVIDSILVSSQSDSSSL